MRLPRTPQFDEERERFSLRFCCEDCGHFNQSDEQCRHFWPNQQHRVEHRDSWVDFCKEFELC